VPFNGPLGLIERGVLNADGKTSGRAQSAVRPISIEDFNRFSLLLRYSRAVNLARRIVETRGEPAGGRRMLNDGNADHPREPNRPSLARQLARIGLGLNTYTQWYWKVDLRELLHFLKLPADRHAQYEIRVYAEAILDIVER
jgi:thymidylate synthase ThyX